MTEFAGYKIDMPFGPAAGVLTGVNETVLQAQTIDCIQSPVGFAKWGSFTYEGGLGNEQDYGLTYYHNPLTGQTINSGGLPNIGSKRAVKLYPGLQKIADYYGKPLIPSISPGKGEDPAIVIPEMADMFADAGAPAIELNYSCSNKITASGGREALVADDLEEMRAIDNEVVRRVGHGITVIRKLPPYLNEKKLLIPEVASFFVHQAGRVALGLCNTVGNQSILKEDGDNALTVPGNLGGLSGPATALIGRGQMQRFEFALQEAKLDHSVDIISGLGVMTGDDVYSRTKFGGALLTEGATIYFENENLSISYGNTGVRIAAQYAEAMETGF